MAWSTSTPPKGIVLHRVILGAHEASHFLAFRHAGVKVKEVVIHKNGDGRNLVDDDTVKPKQWPGFLVALLAGPAGERYWCDQHGVPLPDYAAKYQGDRDTFHECRDQALNLDLPRRYHNQVRDLTERKAAEQGLRIVRARFRETCKLAEQLARRGRLYV